MVSSTTPPQAPTFDPEAERLRLKEAHENTNAWYRWGPYLSER